MSEDAKDLPAQRAAGRAGRDLESRRCDQLSPLFQTISLHRVNCTSFGSSLREL